METVAEQLARRQRVADLVAAQRQVAAAAAVKRHNNRHVARIDGVLTVMPGKAPASAKGSFLSKQGTKRRSSKGRVYTMPNGYSKYIAPYSNYEVVLY